MKFRISLVFFIGFFSGMNMFGQEETYVINKEQNYIYEIEKKIMLGDKTALLEIAPYLDNKKEIIIYLGYHLIKTTESQVVKRILIENCIFIDNEITFSDKTTTKQFRAFLDQNLNQISFSNHAQVFLLIPLEKRTAKFDVREISLDKKKN